MEIVVAFGVRHRQKVLAIRMSDDSKQALTDVTQLAACLREHTQILSYKSELEYVIKVSD